MSYNQQEFSKALQTAGFKRDGGVYQPGTLYFTRSIRVPFGQSSINKTFTVSLNPTFLTTSVGVVGRDGLKVQDQFTTDNQGLFLTKLREWGLQ